jgi:peptide/nickel transport system substrate-binding protein
MHLWHPEEEKPATPWEAELDRLMNEQLTTQRYTRRKQLFDRVQEIVNQKLPVIWLASPNILVGAKDRVRNFHPAILEPYVLWNIETMYVR